MFHKRNAGLISLYAIVLMSFIFVYSEAYHKLRMDYFREIVLACMAAAVTILITALLLRQQTQSEELKDSHSEVFRKKFEVYTDFLRTLIACFEEDTNKTGNVRILEENFYKLLLFIDNQESFDEIYEVVLNCLQSNERAGIGPLLHTLRMELGIHETVGSAIDPGFWNLMEEKMEHFLMVAEQFKKTQK